MALQKHRLYTASVLAENVVYRPLRALKGGESWPELEGLTVGAARVWLVANGYYYLTVITSGAEEDVVCSARVGGTLTCCGIVTHSIKLRAGVNLETGGALLYDYDAAGWIGTHSFEDLQSCFGGQYKHVTGASGGQSFFATAPGTHSVRLKVEYSSHSYTASVLVRDTTMVNPDLGPTYIMQNVIAPACSSYTLIYEVPAGYDETVVTMAGKLGGWRYQGFIHESGCG